MLKFQFLIGSMRLCLDDFVGDLQKVSIPYRFNETTIRYDRKMS